MLSDETETERATKTMKLAEKRNNISQVENVTERVLFSPVELLLKA